MLTLELDPKDSNSLEVICHYHESKKEFSDAILAAEKLRPIDELTSIMILGCIYAWSGNRNEAMKCLTHLRELSKRSYVRVEYYSFIHAALGENDLALDWLEKAVENRSAGVVYVKTVTVYNSLRLHPRFQAILKKMNLPP